MKQPEFSLTNQLCENIIFGMFICKSKAHKTKDVAYVCVWVSKACLYSVYYSCFIWNMWLLCCKFPWHLKDKSVDHFPSKRRRCKNRSRKKLFRALTAIQLLLFWIKQLPVYDTPSTMSHQHQSNITDKDIVG